MTPRSLLAALLSMLVLLGVAFWVVHEEAPLAGDALASRAAGAPRAPAFAAPGGDGVPAETDGLPSDEAPHEPQRLEPAEALRPPLEAADLSSGAVTGRLVDEQGRPVSGEPLTLVLARDGWSRGLPSASARRSVLSNGRADADGRFRLPARPGAEHELFAGGERHPRRQIGGVASGDELLVELETARFLEGVVREQETGDELAGARVVGIVDGSLLLAETDEAGAFRLGPLGSPAVTVAAVAEGFDVAVVDDPPIWTTELLLELPPGRTLAGSVVEQEGGAPIPGAEVRVTIDLAAWLDVPDGQDDGSLLVVERVTSSDELGRFELEGLASVGFTTTVRAEGYLPRRIDKHVERPLEEDHELELRLEPLAVLTGLVVAGAEALPVAGATIAVLSADDVLAHAVSDEGGSFSATLEAWDGNGPLVVEARDGQGRRGRLQGKLHEEEELLLTLVEPVRVPVLVLAAGEPLPGAHVAVFSEGALPTLGVTDGEGRLTLEHALAGADVESVRIVARHGGDESLPLIVALAELAELPEDEPLRLELDLGDWLHGRVRDIFGQDVAAARLAVRFGPFGHTDDEGAFRLGPLDAEAAEPWRLTVEAEGYRTEQLEVVPDGLPIDVLLEPVVRWQGRVVDTSTGRPPELWAGVLEVELERDGKRSYHRTGQRLLADRDDPGAFEVMLPEAGRYRILVEALDAIAVTSAVEDFDGHVPPPYAELLVYPAAVLELLITDDAGRAVEGYGLDVIDWQRAGDADRPSRGLRRTGRSGRTDEHGQVRLNLGPGGAYRIAGGGTTWLEPGRLVVPPGPALQRRYTVGPSGDVQVTVVDAAGLPVAPAKVSVRTGDRTSAHMVARSGRTSSRTRDGLLFEAIPAGSYRVTVKAKGYAGSQRQVVVSAGRLQHVDVTLQPVTADDGGEPGARGGKQGRGGGRR